MTDQPPTDRRTRIVEALVTTSRAEWPYRPGMEKFDHHKHGDRPGHSYSISCALCTGDVDRLADVLVAVLPPPADRAAVLLEAANALACVGPETPASGPQAWTEAIETLRRMAAEVQQQPDTETLVCVCGAPAVQYGDRWGHEPGTGEACLYRPYARPRCPDCQMPHDLTPGMARVCASILASIADRDAVEGSAAAATGEETVHGCPPDGSGLTPCCGRTPFELPLGDRISSEAPVTCKGARS